MEPVGKKFPRLGVIKRKSTPISDKDLVNFEFLDNNKKFPLIISPKYEGLNLIIWANNNKDMIESFLTEYGAVLFRDFNMKTVSDFENFVSLISTEVLDYTEQSSPRHKISNHIYTSTDYPSDRTIFLHNENSYSKSWPMKIFFFCLQPAEFGGATPIADCRKVLKRIDFAIVEKFIEKNWMLIRNYGDGLGLSWQKVFQTSNPMEVDEFCHSNDIQVDWKVGDRLRTRAIRSVCVMHPITNQMVWFNHATFFHISTVDSDIQKALLEGVDYTNLPNNTYYGDGSPIEVEVLDQIRKAYNEETVYVNWKSGDILLLDNILTAHGREAYKGERKIVVGMGDSMNKDDLKG